jgi:preprotein translocase subunit SecA
MSFLSKIFGSNEREITKFRTIVDQINAKESAYEKMSDDELKDQTRLFREKIAEKLKSYKGESIDTEDDAEADVLEEEEVKRRLAFEQKVLDELLPDAYAVVREAARRTLKQRHYDVQMIGGIVLHQGKIAEMRTGEGKTLVATLPLYLNALLGKGVHLVTVNDFLGKYHAQWMGQVYHALGMTTGAIEHDKSWLFTPDAKNIDDLTEEELEAGLIDPDWPHLTATTRREAYAADITYGTNNEFGFDYLRDNMVQRPDQMVQRGHRFAIVDEVDSILIDEARTPLIISAPAEESASTYGQFATIARGLKAEEHYTVNEKDRAVSITDAGIAEVERITGVPNFYAAENIMNVHHLEAALKAEALFARDKDYVVRDNEIIIIDEFTGRLMDGRRYSEGLHQAIEAKEGVEVKRESDTLATVSFQNLFRMYDKLGGMTGTAETEAEEFYKIYQLEVVSIPTNRPMVRNDQQDLIYKNEPAKFKAVIEDVKQRAATGQPVLIGTISVAKNELLSEMLTKAGVKHQVLNAKKHEQEAQIIAQAGRLGAVTLATNMAGRGVDIILGGMPADKAEAEKVRELGGLHVIGTERHESRRIDNQLRGRAGRQGDPGSSIFFVSMEDDLMRIFGGERMKSIMEKLGVPDEEAIQHSMISGSIESAQKRVEGHNFDIRKHLVEYDDVMNKHRLVIYRRRRHIMEYDPAKDNWLHEDVLDMLSDEEKPLFEKKIASFSLEGMKQLERAVYLQIIDRYWIDHLNAMQELREGIGLRGYGQHDPLVEYKHEAYDLFQRLLESIDDEVVEVLLKAELVQAPAPAPVEETRHLTFQGADESLAGGAISNMSVGQEAEAPASPIAQSASMSNSDVQISVRKAGETVTQPAQQTKLGRNDQCFCGSGLKFKKCHGK